MITSLRQETSGELFELVMALQCSMWEAITRKNMDRFTYFCKLWFI